MTADEIYMLVWLAASAVVCFWMSTGSGLGPSDQRALRGLAVACAAGAFALLFIRFEVRAADAAWLVPAIVAAVVLAAGLYGLVEDRRHRRPVEELRRSLHPL